MPIYDFDNPTDAACSPKFLLSHQKLLPLLAGLIKEFRTAKINWILGLGHLKLTFDCVLVHVNRSISSLEARVQ